uniref:Uncharacterized protein n=1 Tax=Triticum urartu TaxID=4572 RepID=A0A8R7PTY5_TRIUA
MPLCRLPRKWSRVPIMNGWKSKRFEEFVGHPLSFIQKATEAFLNSFNVTAKSWKCKGLFCWEAKRMRGTTGHFICDIFFSVLSFRLHQFRRPNDAVAEELLGLLALADEAAGLHLLRVAAGLHHPARADVRRLAAASAGEVGDVAEPAAA